MRIFVRCRFSFVPGFFGKRSVGSLMDLKMEDVINQSSNYNLKFCSIFILIHSTKPKSTAAVKILTASYSTKLINIHDSVKPTSLFPHLFLLGPADRFLTVLCVCRRLFGNRLVASLHKGGHRQHYRLTDLIHQSVTQSIMQHILTVSGNPHIYQLCEVIN